MLLSEAKEILEKNGYRLDEAALTMKSLNKTLNQLFGNEYNVVADVSPRKWYIQYYDFDTGMYFKGKLKADRLTDFTLEEWIEETKKVAKEVKKSRKRIFGEAYDAVTDRNNIKNKRQINQSYLTLVMKRLKDALAEKSIDSKLSGYNALKIGKYKVTLYNTTEEYANVKEFGKNYIGAESGDDASYSQMDSNVILRFWDTTHLNPDEKAFDVRNTPGMVKWILSQFER